MFDSIVNHVESTWEHVLRGKSTTAEKLEFAGEALVGAAILAKAPRIGLTRNLVNRAESLLPKLGFASEKAAKEVGGSLYPEVRDPQLRPAVEFFRDNFLAERKNLHVLELGSGPSTAVPKAFKNQMAEYTSVESGHRGYHPQESSMTKMGGTSARYKPIIGDMHRDNVAASSQDVVVNHASVTLSHLDYHQPKLQQYADRVADIKIDFLSTIHKALKPGGYFHTVGWNLADEQPKVVEAVDRLFKIKSMNEDTGIILKKSIVTSENGALRL